MKTTRRERLEMTLSSMERAGPEGFDQKSWCRRSPEFEDSLLSIVHEGTVIGECGTMGCLAGHAVSAATGNGTVDEITINPDWDLTGVAVAAWLGIDWALFEENPWDDYRAHGYNLWAYALDMPNAAPTEIQWALVCDFLRDEIKREIERES